MSPLSEHSSSSPSPCAHTRRREITSGQHRASSSSFVPGGWLYVHARLVLAGSTRSSSSTLVVLDLLTMLVLVLVLAIVLVLLAVLAICEQ